MSVLLLIMNGPRILSEYLNTSNRPSGDVAMQDVAVKFFSSEMLVNQEEVTQQLQEAVALHNKENLIRRK